MLGPQHAKALLDVNAKVVLADISNRKLQDLKKILIIKNCFFYQLDVTSEEDIRKLHDELKKNNL